MHVLHLNKSGSGMASVTACGRNILRTPFSASWNEYKTAQGWTKCAKCEASKQAELNRRTDAKNADVAAPVEPDAWEPEGDANAWIGRDAEMIAVAKMRGVTLSLNERITAPAIAPGEPLSVMALAARINRECLDWLEIPDTDGELMLVAMPHGVVTMFTDMNGYATPEECYSAAPHAHRIVAPSWNAYVVDLTKRAAPECVAFLADVAQESNAVVMARGVAFVRDIRLTAEYLAARNDEPATLDDGMSSNEQVRALAAEQARADAARKLSGVPSLVLAGGPSFGALMMAAHAHELHEVPEDMQCDHCGCEKSPGTIGGLCADCQHDDDNPSGFINHYKCHACAFEWVDEWSCMVDDDCPECGARHCSPYLSEDAA